MAHNIILFNPKTGDPLPLQERCCTYCGAMVPPGGFTGRCPCPQQSQGKVKLYESAAGPAGTLFPPRNFRKRRPRKIVQSLYRQVGLNVVIGDPLNAEGGASFERFCWGGRSEDEGLPDARTHIENQLEKFGVHIGRGGYKVLDVHKNKQLLDRGHVVPFKTADASISRGVSVLWELKTEVDKSEQPDALMQFEPQGCLELLAARCLSDQPGVLVVITDLVSGAVLLEVAYNQQFAAFDVLEHKLTLDEMGYMVAKFLSETAVPDASFRPIDEQNPRDFPVITFKKTKLSHDIGLALEHFNDMAADTEPNSRERAYLVEQLFRSMEVPRMPTIVHYSMYS
eukprot:scaffold867_cov176-Ochromonas_danica.AAC.11